jgi:lysophospholipase L1-like esterase
MLLLICAALPSSVAFGQSFSITRQSPTNYSIQASAPMDNPYTLQASANLHLWADIHDPVQGQYSSPLAGMEVSQRYFRLVPSSPPPQPIIVMLLGDSLVADGSGWGWGTYGYFKTNSTTVVNYAQPWTSTGIFLQSAEWDEMLLVQPNYVLMEYGWSDGNSQDTDRFTTLQQFHDNLTTIGQTVRGWGGVPIFLTLHPERVFDTNGMIVPNQYWYVRNAVTKTVAAEMGAPLIDFYQLTLDLFNQLGPSGTAYMQWHPGDIIHFSYAGAVDVARLIVNALPDNLGPYLTGIFNPPPVP